MSAFATTAIVGCTTQTENRPTQEALEYSVSFKTQDGFGGSKSERRVSSEKRTKAGVITGDNLYSHVYWVEHDVFADLHENWVGAGLIGTRDGSHKSVVYLNTDAPYINDYVIYHERGHNLGFVHSDGGIMSYQTPDIYEDGISDPTQSIAESTNGLSYIEWDTDARRQFRERWRNNMLTEDDALYAFGRRNGQSDIYSNGSVVSGLDNVPDSVKIHSGGFYRHGNSDSGTFAWK